MLAFDMANGLDNQVTVDAEALKNIGKKGDISAPMLGLRAGNTATVRQLLQATLISAANDACIFRFGRRYHRFCRKDECTRHRNWL